MYPSHKFCTRPPIGVIPHEHNFEELFQRDLEKKMQMKGYADNKRYVKPSDIQVGDSIAGPVQERHQAKRPDGSSITRTTAYFEKVPFR